MKYFLCISALLTVMLYAVFCGITFEQDRRSIARSFCQDIWMNNESAEAIASKYLLPHPADMVDKTKRIQFIGELLRELRKDQQMEGMDFHVQPYASVPPISGLDHSVAIRDIYAVTAQNKPVIYILFNGSKIVSCTLILKGSRSYFMTW